MACRIDIKEAINKSINNKVDFNFWGYSLKQAKDLTKWINDLWDTKILSYLQRDGRGAYQIIKDDNKIEEAVEKEYQNQLKAEEKSVKLEEEQQFKDFRPQGFYKNDFALQEQERKDFENYSPSFRETLNNYNLSLQNEKEEILYNIPFAVQSWQTNTQSGINGSNQRTIFENKEYLKRIIESDNSLLEEKLRESINFIRTTITDSRGMVGKIFGKLRPKILISKEPLGDFVFMQRGDSIVINPSGIAYYLFLNTTDKSHFPDYLHKSLLEELIHVKANQKLTPKLVNTIYNELSEKDRENINRYYNSNSPNKMSNSQIVHEYIRQVVQNQLIGETTEESLQGFAKLTKTIIDLLKGIFQDIINIYKGNTSPIGNKTIDEITKELKNLIRGERINIDSPTLFSPVPNSIEQKNQINYVLKSIDILNSKQAIDWFKRRDKGQWEDNLFYQKLQQDLKIPKQQINLIKSLDLQNPYNREEILTSLASNYSYTIEINTAKEYVPKNFNQYHPDSEIEIERNSQYYSNLTILGGINYTENEISTPLITPSIKGHAQFATNNGIGWFRSDDKAINNQSFEEFQKDMKERFNYEVTRDDYDYATQNKTAIDKTRRILEVQSDLFQKGRDREDLAGLAQFTKQEREELQKLPLEEYKKRLAERRENPNKFLQLLNKNNNWVTFFVKSIIQDSAKKGYEKVLFPTGDTASKIEGHATLEEFKKQKEDRLTELENNTYSEHTGYKLNNGTQQSVKWIGDKYFLFENYLNQENKKEITKKEFEQKLIDRNIIEINQLKAELERVETEGFGALRPIYNFYENTVTNILKKQGYNPVEVIDEYGNKWNEIEITPETSLDTILLAPTIPNQIKEGVSELFESNPELASIGTQEQYSQYLDTIFPDSKVKDIVYHGSKYGSLDIKNIKNYKPSVETNRVGIFFSKRRDLAETYSKEIEKVRTKEEQELENEIIKSLDHEEREWYFRSKANIKKEKLPVFSAIINLSNPKQISLIEWDKIIRKQKYGKPIDGENLKKSLKSENYDSIEIPSFLDGFEKFKNKEEFLVFRDKKDFYKLPKTVQDKYFEEYREIDKNIADYYASQYAVFEPEQIHILGSKQDIKNFANFVAYENSDFSKIGNINQFRDYIMSKNFAAIEEFLVVNNKIDRKC